MNVLPRHKRDGNFANQWQKRRCTPSRMTFRPWIEFASGNRVPLSLILVQDFALSMYRKIPLIELTSVTIISLTPSLLSCFPAGLDYFCPSNRHRPRVPDGCRSPFSSDTHQSIGERESIEWRQIAKHRVRQPPRRRSHHFRTLTMDAAIIVRGEKRECGGRGGLCRIVHHCWRLRV